MPYDISMSATQPIRTSLLFHPPSSPISYRPSYTHPPLAHHTQSSTSSSSSSPTDYLPTPPLEFSEAELFHNQSQVPETLPFSYLHPSSPHAPPRPPHPVVPSQSPLFALPQMEEKEPARARKLAGGDVLYWHNLTRNGEMAEIKEDRRARIEFVRNNARASAMAFDR